MNANAKRRYRSSTAVRDFYTARPAIFNGSAKGRDVMAEHADIVGQMDTHLSTIDAGHTDARKATAERTTAREALRDTMTSIRSISKVLSTDTNAVDALFPLPDASADDDLLSRARTMQQHAASMQADLVANGLPEAALTDLPAQIQRLGDAIGRQQAARRTRMGAFAGIAELQSRASKLHRSLDAIFQGGPPQDADTVRVWKDALHVGPSRANTAQAAEPKPATPASTESKVVA